MIYQGFLSQSLVNNDIMTTQHKQEVLQTFAKKTVRDPERGRASKWILYSSYLAHIEM